MIDAVLEDGNPHAIPLAKAFFSGILSLPIPHLKIPFNFGKLCKSNGLPPTKTISASSGDASVGISGINPVRVDVNEQILIVRRH